MNVDFDKDALYPFLIYSNPIKYNDHITLFPVTMNHILEFNIYSQSIIVRKNSRFPDKKIIKMNYMDFLIHAAKNPDLGEKYGIPDLKNYYSYLLLLFHIVCPEHDVRYNEENGIISINNFDITATVLDDLRKIIIIQNDIDFDIDEFLNYDTEKRLQKARKDLNKNSDDISMEDYIDSLSVAIHLSEAEIMNISIRKFWRLIKRFNLHENYTICKTGEASGMVKYKEPIRHWMKSINENDKFEELKTNEDDLRDKVS